MLIAIVYDTNKNLFSFMGYYDMKVGRAKEKAELTNKIKERARQKKINNLDAYLLGDDKIKLMCLQQIKLVDVIDRQNMTFNYALFLRALSSFEALLVAVPDLDESSILE
jgi:hypothetical protein